MYVAIVVKDDYLLGSWNGNQKTWGIVLFGENDKYGHCILVLGVVVEELVCCVNLNKQCYISFKLQTRSPGQEKQIETTDRR
jgi:hypothetical protein